MRKRDLRPSFFTDEDLVDLDPLTRILFQGLWCMADRVAILEDRPKKIKMKILPADTIDVDAALDELAQANMITRYTASTGQKLIHVTNLEKQQNFHPGEKPVGFEPPPETTATTQGIPEETSRYPSGNHEETTGGCEQLPSNALTSLSSLTSLEEGGIEPMVSKGTNRKAPESDPEFPPLSIKQSRTIKTMCQERDLTESDVCEAIEAAQIHGDNYTEAFIYLKSVDKVDTKELAEVRELDAKNRKMQQLMDDLLEINSRGHPEEVEAFIAKQDEQYRKRLRGLMLEIEAVQEPEPEAATG